MILEFNIPYSLNLGEDFEYVSTFIKGKKSKNILDLRFLFKGIKSNKLIFLYFDLHTDLYHNCISSPINKIITIEEKYCKKISDKHYKFKNYNYYYYDNNYNNINLLLTSWKNLNPIVYIGNYEHQYISNIKNYTYTYKFNNQTY